MAIPGRIRLRPPKVPNIEGKNQKYEVIPMLLLCLSSINPKLPLRNCILTTRAISELVTAERIPTIHGMFPNTQWTELAHATLRGDEAGRAALDAMCRTYWEPVRLYILQRGWAPHEAPDLAQSFFLFLMEKGMLHRAEREKGRFRGFLQGVLNNFLLTERDRRNAQKRGSGREHVELEDDSASADATAEREFDRQWALAIMETALQRVSSECTAKRGEGAFEVMSVFIGGKGEFVPQELAAGRLGMPLGTFRSEIFTWRKKLREYLRAEVRRTVSAPHEVDEEMSYLWQLLTAP